MLRRPASEPPLAPPTWPGASTFGGVMAQQYSRHLLKPINHGTILQCHQCGSHDFQVMWFRNPIW